MPRVQLRVQDNLREQIEEQAARLGLTLSEYVIGAIADRLQRDAEAASKIKLVAESRDWFFDVLEQNSALPDSWNRAAKNAADIDG
ncbi:MAG: DUF1778 domain-containing protein [Proteobacteria bacterium]|nr:DUF1778 domain-containing protein [Pseudomonadota bacterium]